MVPDAGLRWRMRAGVGRRQAAVHEQEKPFVAREVQLVPARGEDVFSDAAPRGLPARHWREAAFRAKREDALLRRDHRRCARGRQLRHGHNLKRRNRGRDRHEPEVVGQFERFPRQMDQHTPDEREVVDLAVESLALSLSGTGASAPSR